MSFSKEQKLEIINSQYKSICCRRALLSGILAAKASVADSVITLRLTEHEVIDFTSQLIAELYSKPPEILSAKCGGRGRILSYKSNSAAKFLSEIKNSAMLMYHPKCTYCKGAFLRGVFLSSGRVSEPAKQYALEFSFIDDAEERFFSYFSELGVPLKRTDRGGKTVLYTKNSTEIEDFFGLCAMNNTAFSIMNSKIKSELRNDANRISNCEMNNIDKAVNTAMRQIAVISALEEAGLLSSLPDELALTARLRLEYNSLSLSQLAAKFTPSISKPGLSHRLNKIEEMGKKLLKPEN